MYVCICRRDFFSAHVIIIIFFFFSPPYIWCCLFARCIRRSVIILQHERTHASSWLERRTFWTEKEEKEERKEREREREREIEKLITYCMCPMRMRARMSEQYPFLHLNSPLSVRTSDRQRETEREIEGQHCICTHIHITSNMDHKVTGRTNEFSTHW